MLQPGLDLLDRDKQFPDSGPVLIITDGQCEVLKVRREHAYLIPVYGSLPFAARVPV